MRWNWYVFDMDGLWEFVESGYSTKGEAIDSLAAANLDGRKRPPVKRDRIGEYTYFSPSGGMYFVKRKDRLTADEIELVTGVEGEELVDAQQLSDLKKLCEFLFLQPGKSAYTGSVPRELQYLLDRPLLEKRNELKSKGLLPVFYSTGWGWRLRKDWQSMLQKLEGDSI